MPKKPYRLLCETYFKNTDNQPYSIQEACAAMDIDYATLLSWETGKDKSLRTLARQAKQRVAAGWEKGEISPSLAAFLLKSYMGLSERPDTPAEPLEITVRVVGDEA